MSTRPGSDPSTGGRRAHPEDDPRAPRDPHRPWNGWLLPGWDDAPPPATPPASGPAGQPGLPHLGPRIRSVGEVTREIRDRLRAVPALRDLWVEGEIGQVSLSAAGHCYFTLKDDRAQLRAVIFRDERRAIPFEPRTGLRIVAHGRVDVFEQQGHYQLYVDALQPAGLGDLALKLEAIKARLAAEGLFEVGRKRPLPPWPRLIGVATSAQGAVLHDITRVLARRWPLARLLVAPCLVQGDAAAASMIAALRRLARWVDPALGTGPDLVILARGGGSLEDLWPFNDERVVRAVAAYPVPVISGVGHETDVTLVDFAADVRAATPSVAAELAVPARLDQVAALHALGARLGAGAERALRQGRTGLVAEARALARLHPAAVLAGERERIGLLLDRARARVAARIGMARGVVERAEERLPLAARGHLLRAATGLEAARSGLVALGPYATLERGYAIVRDTDGALLRDASAVLPGARLDVRLARGALDARVEAVRDSTP